MTVIQKVSMVRETMHVEAPPEVVWRVFSQLDRRAEWNPVCQDVAVASRRSWELGMGFSFSVKPWWKTLRVRATVVDSNPPRQVVWIGRGLGIFGQHSFTFEPEDLGTFVTTTEIFGGPLQWAMPLVAPMGRIRWTFVQWLEALKREVEQTG